MNKAGMRKYCIFLLFCSIVVGTTGCSYLTGTAVMRDYPIVPEEGAIPGVPPESEFADYWIRQYPDPDEVLMTPEEITKFNDENPAKGNDLIDIPGMTDECEGANIRDYVAKSARYLASAHFLVTGRIPLEQAERQRIIALMDTLGVQEVIPVRFGMTIQPTMTKLWPTTIPLLEKEGDNEFDMGVVSSVDIATPVAVLHTSRDGRWALVQTPRFLCWMPASAFALGDREIIRTFTDCSPPLVAVGHRVSVYANPAERVAASSIQMGSHLPLRTAGNDFFEVLVPGRGKNGELVVQTGYVRHSSDVSIGFLPYTIRNVFRQCYILYGRRFGWGGMFEERDCSRYIMDVFRCFNIQLPRNSSRQAEASKAVISLDGMDKDMRLELLEKTPGGISLLRMPGHNMIYLGSIDGKPYAIHNFWAWRTPSDSGEDIVHRTARVAVSGLDLGEGSKRGSFIDRLTHVTILGNYTIETR